MADGVERSTEPHISIVRSTLRIHYRLPILSTRTVHTRQVNKMSATPSNSGLTVGGPDPEVMAAIERGNAVVFFDVALGEGANSAELGRIKVELFVKDVSDMMDP